MADENINIKPKLKKFWLGQMNCTEEVLTNLDTLRESVIKIGDSEFETCIKFDEGREKFHALITKEGRTTSLSFFPTRKTAFKAILMSVAALMGFKVENGLDLIPM
jgi:hypothetical protein